MMVQVDLHTADIDGTDTARLQFPDVNDGFGYGREKSSVRAVRDGPWLGKNCLPFAIPAVGLGLCDRRQKIIGNIVLALCVADG